MRRQISSGSPLEATIGFSRAVRDEHLIFVSATAAIRPATGFIVVRGFLDPRWLGEIEVDAVVGS